MVYLMILAESTDKKFTLYPSSMKSLVMKCYWAMHTANWRTWPDQNSSTNPFYIGNNIEHHVESIAQIHICMASGSKLHTEEHRF